MVNKKNNSGKIPPQNLEVEAAVIGSLMLEPHAIHKVTGIINEDSFYLDSHRKIYEAVKSLSNANKPIDLLTVTKALRDKNELDEIGGAMFVTQLCSGVASAAHIEHHAGIIQQLHIQRELIKIGSETITEAYEEGVEIEDLLNSIKSKVSTLEDSSSGSNTGQSHSDVFMRMIIDLEHDCTEHAKGIQPGINTGFKELNNSTGGWRKSNLIIIASRPAVGKTSLALHFAKLAALSGKWVNFYSMEMTAPDLQRIMLSGETGINRTAIRDGALTDKNWDTINSRSANFEKLLIRWYDNAGLTSAMIKANTIRNHKAGKCDIVIIDYLQLIKAFDKRAVREQQISEISRTLKEIALSMNIPVVCLSQFNRAAADSPKPQLHHLRESGAIEQDADVVMAPWRNGKDGIYYLSILKNRRGKLGDIPIFANEEMTVFSDSPPGAVCQSNPKSNAVVYDPDRNISPTNSLAF